MADQKATVGTAGEGTAPVGVPNIPGQAQELPKALRIADQVLKAFQIIGMAVVVALMLLTVAHVIGRYAFHYPMLGVVEVSGLMVITLVFLAAPYDFYIDRHIAVDVIVRRLPEKAALVVSCFTYFVALVVVTLALVWTIKTGQKISGSGATTDILRIPLYPFYFVVAFGWLLSLLSIAARLARYFLRPGGECEPLQPAVADKAVDQ